MKGERNRPRTTWERQQGHPPSSDEVRYQSIMTDIRTVEVHIYALIVLVGLVWIIDCLARATL